jgi:hypothetical protein
MRCRAGRAVLLRRRGEAHSKDAMPHEGVAFVLMKQRSNFPNSDASDVRREFQKAAVTAMAKPAL